MQRQNNSKIPVDLLDQIDRVSEIIFDMQTPVQEVQAISLQLFQQILSTSNIRIFKHPNSSRTLQVALQHVYLKQKHLVISLFQAHFRDMYLLMSNQNASFVVETLLQIISVEARKNETLNNLFREFIEGLDLPTILQSEFAVQVLKALLYAEAGRQRANVTAKHIFLKLFVDDRVKSSDYFQPLMIRVYDAVKSEGFAKTAEFADVSTLLQVYIELYPVIWDNNVVFAANYSSLNIFFDIYNVKDFDKEAITEYMAYCRGQKSFFQEPKFSEIAKLLQFHYSKTLPGSSIYVIESVISRNHLLSCCYMAFINEVEFSKVVQLQFTIQKALSLSHLHPLNLVAFTKSLINNLDQLFDLEEQVLLANVILPLQLAYHRANSLNESQLASEILQQLLLYVNALADSTGQSEDFVRKLLFPSISLTQDLKLESMADRYTFNHLGQVDISKYTDDQFKEFIQQRREERKRVQQLQIAKRFQRKYSMEGFDKPWPIGKAITIKLLNIDIPEVLVIICKSFEKSFIDKPKELSQLIQSPHCNEIVEQFAKNLSIPVFYKLKIVSGLKGSFADEVKSKLGRKICKEVAYSCLERIQIENDVYDLKSIPISVNLDSLKVIVQELTNDLSTVKFLQKYEEGRDLCKVLKLELFLGDQRMKQSWEQQIIKILEVNKNKVNRQQKKQ